MKAIMILISILMATPVLAESPEGMTLEKAFQKYSPDAIPNLMAITVFRGKELKLTEAQNKILAKARAKMMPKRSELTKTLLKARETMVTMAMGDADKGALTKQSAEIQRLVKELSVLKIMCRTELKTTLTPEQWTKMVVIQKQLSVNTPK